MTRKQFLLGILAITLVFTMTAVGCDNGNDTPAHVHEWGEWVQTKAPTATEEGEETKTCATCGEKETRPIPKTTHTHDWGEWAVTTPPTTTAEGVETRTCKRDPSHKETRPIAKLPDTEPKNQTATITLSFKKPDATDADPFLTATVKGNLTDAQWDGVADKIKTTLNDLFGPAPNDIKERWKTVFSRDVTYIVEASPVGYTNYKLVGDGKTVYISLNTVNGADLVNRIGLTVNALYNNASTIVKAIDNSRNIVRMAAIQPKQDRVHAG